MLYDTVRMLYAVLFIPRVSTNIGLPGIIHKVQVVVVVPYHGELFSPWWYDTRYSINIIYII